MRLSLTRHATVLLATMFVFRSVLAVEPERRSPSEWMALFSARWNETTWHTPFRTAPSGYMRKLDDTDWKLRMEALQGIVASGKDAIPVLLAALQAKEVPTRIFAAQTLG